jgi:hypothetical protein
MIPFTPAELAAMRGVQSGAMMDTCTLRVLSVTQDAYGEEVESWAEQTDVACGLDVTGGIAAREQARPGGAIVTISAMLRLSLEDGEGLNEEDAVTVTHRNGELLTPPLAYHIDGYPQRGPTGYTLRLVEVR